MAPSTAVRGGSHQANPLRKPGRVGTNRVYRPRCASPLSTAGQWHGDRLRYSPRMPRLLRIWVLLLCAALAMCAQAGMLRGADLRLHVDVRVEHAGPETERALQEAGLQIELAVPDLGRWQGWVAADRIAQLRRAAGVLSVSTPRYARFAAGAALSEGDEALNAAAARTRFNVDGSDIRIAVISDGIQGLKDAQQIGEAPKLVDARGFGAGGLDGGEEGTAMIEVIHDLAPGADISFAAVVTDLDHIAAVNHYAKHVDIIVDDVAYPLPADQRSDVSRNTTAALEHPDWPLRAYVTSAGNWAESHWSGEWRPGVDGRSLGLSTPGMTHRFGGKDGESGEDSLSGSGNGFRVKHGDRILLALFWDDTWDRSTNDYNLYLMADDGQVIASSETRQGIGIDSHEPREYIEHEYRGDDATVYAVIQNPRDDAAPVSFQLFVFNTSGQRPQFTYRTPEGSMLAQSDAAGAITVGAVNVGMQMLAAYSSSGPTLNGLAKPEIAAVDMVTVSDTTMFAPRFRGSSAAAPHVAAVAALLLEAQPALLAADGGNPLLERRLIRDLLTETARDLLPRGGEQESGAGLVDAEAAISAAISAAAVVKSSHDDGADTLRYALASGARLIFFDGSQEDRRIALRSPLPPVPPDTIIDGSDWTLNASGVAVGIALGADCELWGLTIRGGVESGVRVSGNRVLVRQVVVERSRVGVAVHGLDATIAGVEVRGSESHGVLVGEGGSVELSDSTIESNAGAGVYVAAEALGAWIGPSGDPPGAAPPYDDWPPIDPLNSAWNQPRSGPSLQLSGVVSLDGLPAPTGTQVNVYLDRRLAASLPLDDESRFQATITGPGAEIRFAVDGVPLAYREPFTAGGELSLNLRAASRSARVSVQAPGGANLIRANQKGIEIEDSNVELTGPRFVWGNELRGQRLDISSPWPAPTIEELRWSAAGINVAGTASDAVMAHLYAGPAAVRRFVAAAPVVDGAFRFVDLDVDPSATHFSIIGQRPGHRTTLESDVIRVAAAGQIASVTPGAGYVEGGETVEICGSRVALDSTAPRVWIGNRPARVLFWSTDCVSVSTPPGGRGSADLVLHLEDARPIVAIDAFEYRNERIVRLREGWNLVTWSGPSVRAGSAFGALADRDFRVFAWDQERQVWKIYAPFLPANLNSLRTLTHDQPLMIYLEGADIDWPQPAPE
ncbi:MAG: S8 family serine peptidase [Chloroflexi bacterium]|nr:S8 family serine peptidase [Chloroflexota bacterium]MYI04080.1 S8 family serine peptidase [Chloroflexota bacterium]